MSASRVVSLCALSPSHSLSILYVVCVTGRQKHVPPIFTKGQMDAHEPHLYWWGLRRVWWHLRRFEHVPLRGGDPAFVVELSEDAEMMCRIRAC